MTISFEVLPKWVRQVFILNFCPSVLFFRTPFVKMDESINSRVLQFSISLSLSSPRRKDRYKMARVEVLTFRVIFHSGRISYFHRWILFFFFSFLLHDMCPRRKICLERELQNDPREIVNRRKWSEKVNLRFPELDIRVLRFLKMYGNKSSSKGSMKYPLWLNEVVAK